MFNFLKAENLRKKALIMPLLGSAMLLSGLTSCDDSVIFENDDSCNIGINLRFVYDYHMEPGANAFPANVDCVNVFVFDTEGNYLDKCFSETTDILKNENYRMYLPLDEGKYHLVVYGGVGCDHPAFNLTPEWNLSSRALKHKDDFRVILPLEENLYSKAILHERDLRQGGLFYGTLDVEITFDDWKDLDKIRTETVYMMKDTNTIQVLLQELSYPHQINHEDFTYQIIDDNFVLDGYNHKVSIATEDYQPYYKPYGAENRVTGAVTAGQNSGDPALENPDDLVQVACVEFSTSRLFLENHDKARLVIKAVNEMDADGNPRVVIDIPLIPYLSATKGFSNNWIRPDEELEKRHPYANSGDPVQQYLDRQSDWHMIFFLQKNVWVKTTVVVNDWTVRVNDIEF